MKKTAHDRLPEEIMLMRRWLGEVFTQASRGLPMPQMLALRLVEQSLALGMFGGLLTSAWLLQEFKDNARDPGNGPDIKAVLQALQDAAIGPLPGPLADAMRALMTGQPLAPGPLATVQDLLEKSFRA